VSKENGVAILELTTENVGIALETILISEGLVREQLSILHADRDGYTDEQMARVERVFGSLIVTKRFLADLLISIGN
jgi:hypothetical protein